MEGDCGRGAKARPGGGIARLGGSRPDKRFCSGARGCRPLRVFSGDGRSASPTVRFPEMESASLAMRLTALLERALWSKR